jgi:hypothetical protein
MKNYNTEACLVLVIIKLSSIKHASQRALFLNFPSHCFISTCPFKCIVLALIIWVNLTN